MRSHPALSGPFIADADGSLALYEQDPQRLERLAAAVVDLFVSREKLEVRVWWQRRASH